MRPHPALAVVSLLALGSCLENEEDIEVRPDGSIQVTLRAGGNLWDLAAGYPLPFGGAWEPIDDTTRLWMREVAPATGGARVRERLEAGAWTPYFDPDKDEVALAVRASFADAAELPRFFAPLDEPYRTALLERTTSLQVEGKGGRTVYTFERTFGARPFWPMLEGDEWLPDDVQETLDAKERLDREQVARVRTLLLEQMRSPRARSVVTTALLAIYTEGQASLSSAGHARTLARLDRALQDVLSLEHVQAFFDAVYLASRDEGEELPDELDLEELLRDAARATLESSLAAEGLPAEVRNAVRERLEWNFSSLDQADDLGDENFVVRVTMPGDVVGGNYDGLDGRTASWEFEGKTLFGNERQLRVVSVLE